MFTRRLIFRTMAAATLVAMAADTSRAELDITYSISNPASFTANQLAILNEGMVRAERMWETMITGYQPGISITTLPFQVQGNTSGLADASATGTTLQSGYRLTTSGRIRININEIENFANWQGTGANGLNFIDELLAHEMGHALGIGLHWDNNSLLGSNSFQYIGQHGLAAYQTEFDAAATFVPIEDAGNAGTIGAHWDQRMRSSSQEGNPSDPWSLDPRVGVTDQYGRDRGLELLTGAIDPDYGEPFLSRFTVQSLRDLGFTVTEFEDFNGDGVVDLADRAILLANMGATGLQIDAMAFGDANGDRVVNGVDLQLWREASGIPEPSTAALAALAFGAFAAVLRRRR